MTSIRSGDIPVSKGDNLGVSAFEYKVIFISQLSLMNAKGAVSLFSGGISVST